MYKAFSSKLADVLELDLAARDYDAFLQAPLAAARSMCWPRTSPPVTSTSITRSSWMSSAFALGVDKRRGLLPDSSGS